MNILVSALYIDTEEKKYGKGGSQKYFTDLIYGLKQLNHNVIPLQIEELYKAKNKIFDLVITSHQETLKNILKNNIQGYHVHIMQGIIPHEEQYIKGADKYVSISEEVRNHNLEKYKADSVVIPQPYKFGDVELTHNKNLPLKILHIKGHGCVGTLTRFNNDMFTIIESDHSRDIKEQIKEADLVIAIGRGVYDAVSCGKAVIVGDTRKYISKTGKGDGLLTDEIFDESLKYNFNGKRFFRELDQHFLYEEISRYLTIETSELEKVNKRFREFDCDKIASRMVELKTY